MVVTVDLAHLAAEARAIVRERLEALGVLGAGALLQPVAVHDRGEVARPYWAAVIAASQLLPSCISPSPRTTNVRQGGPSQWAASAQPTRDREAVPERPGVGLHPGHLVPVRVPVERRQRGHEVSELRGVK